MVALVNDEAQGSWFILSLHPDLINMRTKYILFLFLGAMFACGGKKETKELQKKDPYEKLKSLNWFIGKWENKSPEGIMTESWTMLNDSVYVGTSSYVEGEDTLFSEQIRLEQRGADIFYIPVIEDQNEGKPTQFKLTLTGSQMAKFENPEHDFPQMVTYELKGDSMLAEISGQLEGKDHSEKFPMVKAR